MINNALESLYDRVKDIAGHERAERYLAGLAFIEAFMFPLPPDTLLIPMIMAQRERAWRYAMVAAVFSVLGGIVGYAIGMWAWDAIALPVLEKLGKGESVAKLQALYDSHGALAVFGAGLTPFPYIVITIMSGAMKLNFGVFILMAVLARTLRFYLVAALVYTTGPRAEEIMRKNFALATVVIFALFGGAYALYKTLGH
ncbi:MAG: YqaA family protein [Robiginitomaculum sp.]